MNVDSSSVVAFIQLQFCVLTQSTLIMQILTNSNYIYRNCKIEKKKEYDTPGRCIRLLYVPFFVICVRPVVFANLFDLSRFTIHSQIKF